MTIRQALDAATKLLATEEQLLPAANRDAELLLMHTLDVPRSTIFAYPERELSEAEERSYWQHVYRRGDNEPIQYITGQQEFYGLNFHVAPAVLIPRPETEHLVEAVLQRVPQDEPLEILDVGTGSGILAVTLALKLPFAKVTAVDISLDAIAVARRNAATHHVDCRVHFIDSDLLAAVADSRFDVIVSNPPYIPEEDRDSLHPQVREYEPATALFAGPDGLEIYRRLIPQAFSVLKPNGLLALEIGYGQRTALAGLLTGWQDVAFIDDLQQVPRIVLARRPAPENP